MTPTTAIYNSLAELLAEDSAFLAAAAAKHVHLIKEPFTPSPGTDFTTLVAADFTGSTALNAAAGAQQFFTDAASGRRTVQMIEPVGGWHWTTGDAVNLPQTIYGYVVTDLADTATLASALLPTPIVLSGAGQSVDIAQIRFTMALTPLT